MTVTPECCSSKASPREPIIFSMEVDPSVDTVPFKSWEHPVRQAAAVIHKANAAQIVFFIFIFPFHSLNPKFLWYTYRISLFCKGRKKGFVKLRSNEKRLNFTNLRDFYLKKQWDAARISPDHLGSFGFAVHRVIINDRCFG